MKLYESLPPCRLSSLLIGLPAMIRLVMAGTWPKRREDSTPGMSLYFLKRCHDMQV